MGGEGGEGGDEGGVGGLGQGQRFASKLMVIHGGPMNVPSLTVGAFCHAYRLSDRIRNLLDEQGFKTTAALLEITDDCLREVGFKVGQIAEIKRALRQFLCL
jgi:hypothetical protein